MIWKDVALEDIKCFEETGEPKLRKMPSASSLCGTYEILVIDTTTYMNNNGISYLKVPKEDIKNVFDAFFTVFESKHVPVWNYKMLEWLESQLRFLNIWPNDLCPTILIPIRARALAYGLLENIPWRDIYMDNLQWQFTS